MLLWRQPPDCCVVTSFRFFLSSISPLEGLLDDDDDYAVLLASSIHDSLRRKWALAAMQPLCMERFSTLLLMSLHVHAQTRTEHPITGKVW